MNIPKLNRHALFLGGIVLKGLDGLLEILGSFLFLVLTPSSADWLALTLTRRELAEDPNDWIATHVVRAAGLLTRSELLFGAAYLFVHGAVKVFLVAALLKGRLWSYPLSVIVLLIFIAYQIGHIFQTPGLGMILLTVFDAFVIWLVLVEYKGQRRLLRGKLAR